ncbi:MAG: radical SAM family heme chaperone HemW [Actinomycetaceae bacterium]|nr:radical SAM family heme chaperone HemW [Actinomycetaceae bacterium]
MATDIDNVLLSQCAHIDLTPFSLYVHVPFCQVRCGYCDFNTYTKGFGVGAEPSSYHLSVIREIDHVTSLLNLYGPKDWLSQGIHTLYFGGGTPTLLPTDAMRKIIRHVDTCLGVAADAEISTEANPDTLTPQSIQALADMGCTRVSVGMQSAVPHVLATLDRIHDPLSVQRVVEWVHEAGMDVSLDIIYGTPGESMQDWQTTVDTAIEMQPDHISAYSLVIEQGTKMGAQLKRGIIAEPDSDDLADKYAYVDAALSRAGYRWYEISNWARICDDEHETAEVDATQLRHACRHNVAYWRNWNWWGCGPGAHSHIGQMRAWNVKHPHAYAQRLTGHCQPVVAGRPEAVGTQCDRMVKAEAYGRQDALCHVPLAIDNYEIVDEKASILEEVMLKIRMADGLQIEPGKAESIIKRLVKEEMIDPYAVNNNNIRLTLRGRLMADYVTLLLVEALALQ